MVLTTETSGGGGGGSSSSGHSTVSHTSYINGYPDGSFGPDRGVTREEVTAMLTRVIEYEIPTPDFPPFPDVPVEKWSSGNIAAAKRRGMVKGYDNGNFGPNDPMTRAELATVLVRLAREEGRQHTLSEAVAFPDVERNAWYFDYVVDAVMYGLVTGYPNGTFGPDATVTRAEAVTMINRVLSRNPDTASELRRLTCPFADVRTSYWAYWQIMEASVKHEH